jgi:hypothetical protein
MKSPKVIASVTKSEIAYKMSAMSIGKTMTNFAITRQSPNSNPRVKDCRCCIGDFLNHLQGGQGRV